MWLRDALPHDLPGGRVFTYGYDTRLAESTSFQNLEDVALTFCASLRIALSNRPPDRPLIFVAHSLGGLVLKQALIQMASGDPVDRRIFQSTYGILFFGVPNQGMDISSLIAMVRSQLNLPFLTMFSKDGGSLHGLVEKFRAVFDFKDSEIISLYETCASRTAMKDTNGKWSMSGEYAVLVDRYSARSGRLWEESPSFLQPIARNHSDMVKFSEYDDVGVIVANFLVRFARAAPAIIENRIDSMESTKTWGSSDARPSAFRKQSSREKAKLERPERLVENDYRAVNLQKAIVQQRREEEEPDDKSKKGISEAAVAELEGIPSLGPIPPTPPAPAAQPDPIVILPLPQPSTSNTLKDSKKFVRVEKSFLDGKAEQQAREAPGFRKKEDDLEMFAKAGFNLEAQNSCNRGLTWAIRKGHVSLVHRLLSRGVNPNEHKDEALWTPLHWAAFNANLNLFRLLLSRKADIHAKSKDGHSMLHLVSSFSTDHKRREPDDYIGSSADRRAIAQELLDKRLPVNIQSVKYETPLLCAATCGLEDMTVMLISKGADLIFRDREGCTPLRRAVQKRHVGVVKTIIETIIKSQEKNSNLDAGGCLIEAASKGMEPEVRILLDAGVMLDSVHWDGDTALISAVKNLHVDIVRLLLDKGVELEARQSGKTALIWALSCNHKQEQDRRSQFEVIKLLIDKGANVHAKTRERTTALHKAVEIRNLRAVDLLITAGANTRARNIYGISPEDLAPRNDDEIKDRIKKGLPRKQSSRK